MGRANSRASERGASGRQLHAAHAPRSTRSHAPRRIGPSFAFVSRHISARLSPLITALQYPDLLYLEAAKGWVILGDLGEANRELNLITRELQKHADVLEV